MIEKQIKANVYGEESIFSIKLYSEEDIPWVQRVFTHWMDFKDALKEHDERAPNIPEAVSETIYCILTHAGRHKASKGQQLKDASFDAYDVVKEQAIQIKATQIESDCTSFGPESKWDKLIFVDFYNGGNIDGTVDIYEIPSYHLNDIVVRKKGNVTFKQRQEEGKRPRFSLKESIIIPNSIEPIYNSIKLW